MAPTEELTGDALDARAAELDIQGRSTMTAEQKRAAIAEVEEQGGSNPENDAENDAEGEPDFTSELNDLVDDSTSNNIDPETDKRLEHTQGGVTTRDSAHDQGVPMLQGDPSERVGPEDALGRGDKRGDYETRALPNLQAHEVVRSEEDGAGQPYENEDGGVDIKPHSVLQSQVGRMAQQGEVAGEKGGVDTDPRS